MKVQKMFMVDHEHIAELAKINGSALVNGLLRKHFDLQKAKGMSPETIDKLIELKTQEEALKKEIARLENG